MDPKDSPSRSRSLLSRAVPLLALLLIVCAILIRITQESSFAPPDVTLSSTREAAPPRVEFEDLGERIVGAPELDEGAWERLLRAWEPPSNALISFRSQVRQDLERELKELKEEARRQADSRKEEKKKDVSHGPSRPALRERHSG